MPKRYQKDNQNMYTPLVSFGHCVVCSSMIYRFWLPTWYLLAIVLSVLLWYTDSDYPLESFGHCVVCSSMLSVYHRRTDNTIAKRYQGCNQNLYIIEEQTTQWPKDTKGVIRISIGHCVVCSSMIYRFLLPPWYILAIVLSVLLWYTDSDYTLGICWPLCCLFFYDIQILIIPWYLLAIVLSV
jgi:hypothetical protein